MRGFYLQMGVRLQAMRDRLDHGRPQQRCGSVRHRKFPPGPGSSLCAITEQGRRSVSGLPSVGKRTV
jgi:hypothetical protein